MAAWRDPARQRGFRRHDMAWIAWPVVAHGVAVAWLRPVAWRGVDGLASVNVGARKPRCRRGMARESAPVERIMAAEWPGRRFGSWLVIVVAA